MICVAVVILVFAGEVSMCDLGCRSHIGVCSGSVGVSELCRRRYIGVGRRGVCVRDLGCRGDIGVCSGTVIVSELCRRRDIDACGAGVCVGKCLCGQVSV